MKYLIVVLVLLLGCSTDNEINLKQVKSIVGEWVFEGTSTKGEFTIEKVSDTLTVTAGKFIINGGYEYLVLNPQKVTPSKIFLEGSNGYLVLLKYSISEDYNTITSLLFEYDTDITPTTVKHETVIITRKP